MLSIDMYALTGNVGLPFMLSIDMYALTGNGLTEFVRLSIARRAYLVGIAFKKNAHCG